MSPEEKVFAIAEACGWTSLGMGAFGCYKDQPKGIPPGMHATYRTRLPDYLNDLNACREMEKALKWGSSAARYYAELNIIFNTRGALDQRTDDAALCYVWHATAAQRCEAFLRTIGKWKDEP